MIEKLNKKAVLQKVCKILKEPSPRDETPYQAGATAAWHGLAAMPFGSALGGLWPLGAVAVFALSLVAYWLLKEWGDLARGGDWRDGLADASFVALGLWAGWAIGTAFWWPLLALNAVVIVYFAALVARDR